MRPIFTPLTSYTFVPTKSSILISIALLVVTASGDSLDDVARDPDLPVDRARILRLDIELDIAADRLNTRPRNAHLLAPPGPPPPGDEPGDATHDRINSIPQRWGTYVDVCNVGLRILSDVHH